MKLSPEGFVVAKNDRKLVAKTTALERSLKPVDFYNEMELLAVPTGSIFVFDVETYINFFYVAFKNVVTGKVVAFEQSPGAALDSTKLRWMLWRFCIVGFNSINYDIPMIELAVTGVSNAMLKRASDFIIKSGPQYGTKKVTAWDFQREYKIKIGNYNHVDLFNVAPLEGSLKLYSGRLHCARMQDLPFDEAHTLTEAEAAVVRPYCCNDLDNTQLLAWELWPAIDLRAEMSKTYGVELRSKSDAQVAEAVINKELEKLTGVYPSNVKIDESKPLKYIVPDYVKFKSPELNAMLDKIRAAEFYLDALGSPTWPHGLGELEKSASGKKDKWVLRVNVNGVPYKMGMGGLHSMEKSITHVADADTIIADNDVESFYPRIILNQRLYPSHLGEAFLQVYETLVATRIHAKAQAKICKQAGDKKGEKHWKQIADSLKITINGSFGKLGNKYSTIYAPQLMLQVTISGQLSLLMLIEMLEDAGIPCISGNTDGVISKYRKDQHELCRAVVAEWEKITNFKTEETRYKGVYSRDVNSYAALKLKFDAHTKQWTDKLDGDPSARFLDQRLGFKIKGALSERGSAGDSILSKNPETLIINDALLEFIANGTPLHETIRACTDIRRFIAVKNVKGGGEKGGHFLGKVVRWYYPKNEPGEINYVLSGNKVPKSDGARPVMDLPESFPDDVNYDWYVKEASDLLYDVGIYKRQTTASLF